MKKMIFAVLIILLLSSAVVDAGSFLRGKKRVVSPQFSLSLPKQGQNVVGDAMTVQVLTTNVKIRSGAKRQNKPFEGHLKIIIDSQKPVNAYSPTYRMNIAKLGEGAHVLTVELVQNDGSSLQPAVVRTLDFSVTRTAVKQGNQPKVKKIVHPARLFTEQRI